MSGGIATTPSVNQTHGRHAVRAKLPATTIAGLPSAIWITPEKITYGAASGERDIAEFRTAQPDRGVPYIHDESDTLDYTRTNDECYVDQIPL